MHLFSLLIAEAGAHSALTYPPPRTGQTRELAGICPGIVAKHPGGYFPAPSPGKAPINGTCEWYSNGCQPGCSHCNADCTYAQASLGVCCGHKAMEPTLQDPKLRTYKDFELPGGFDFGMRYNPWRAPGFAPVMDPCGVYTGNQSGEHVTGGKQPGMLGSDLPPTRSKEWPAGSRQEVSFSLYANHGGGYSYRLCPKSSKLTEECFQQNHLQFVGNESWIQYAADEANRTAIPAVRVSIGTNPAGSQWTRNPIPACGGYAGGAPGGSHHTPFWNDCREAQFDPPLKDVIPPNQKYAPLPGLYGFGVGVWTSQTDPDEFAFWAARFNFNIIDLVQIPSNLAPGEYVLGFRWDCEQTPQIWSNCADVTIIAGQNLMV